MGDIRRNYVPVVQAARELTGLPGEFNRETRHIKRSAEYMPLQGRIENGVRVITYTMEAEPKPEYLALGACDIQPVTNDAHHKIMADTFADFEKVANVRFEKIPVEMAHKADIKIFTTSERMYLTEENKTPEEKEKDKVTGYTLGLPPVIVMSDYHFEDSFAHELGHAMGLSHPDLYTEQKWLSSGESPKYSKDGTVMSYVGVHHPEYASKLGPYDIAALQYHYGKPLNTSPDQWLRPARELPATIYSETPVTLDYRNFPLPLFPISLPREEPPIPGSAGLRYHYGSRLAFNTEIANAIFTDYAHELSISGNKLPNLIIGGTGKNSLTAIGANDTLAADPRAQQTWFTISEDSKGTIVANFTPGKDTLDLPGRSEHLLLTHEKRKGHSPGTEVIAYGEHDKILASVFVNGVSPDELTGSIVVHADRSPVPIATSERKDAPFTRMARFHVEESENIAPPPPLVAGDPASKKLNR